MSLLNVGYTNEIGEAFKTHIPKSMYYGSYVVASSYCLADAVSKGRKVFEVRNANTIFIDLNHTIVMLVRTKDFARQT